MKMFLYVQNALKFMIHARRRILLFLATVAYAERCTIQHQQTINYIVLLYEILMQTAYAYLTLYFIYYYNSTVNFYRVPPFTLNLLSVIANAKKKRHG